MEGGDMGPMRLLGAYRFAAILLALSLGVAGVAKGADAPEEVFWQSVRKTDLVEEYGLYLEKYPKGQHVAEARARIEALSAGAQAKKPKTAKGATKEQAAKAVKSATKAQAETKDVVERRKKAEERPIPPVAAKIDPFPPGRVFKDCSDCLDMVVIPSGSFEMGSPASEVGRFVNEGPEHRVSIEKPFALGKTK